MPLLKHTRTSLAEGTVTEEWDVDPFGVLGLGVVVNGLLGMFMWVREKVHRKG